MPIEKTLFLMKMGKKISMTKIIFFDTDCISSFLWTKTEKLLIHCFENRMIIPRQVYDEISKVSYLRSRIDEMVNSGHLLVEEISVASEENKLYMDLTDFTKKSNLPLIGRGEAAAITLSKKHKGVLASNNLKDVKYYVELYKLNHITTADIIHQVVSDGILTIPEADAIWSQIILKKRKLPFGSYTSYLKSFHK